jgi:hypothetical protein
MSRPPPARTIDDIASCLLNHIQWIAYLTARLDVPYDITDPNVDLNNFFRRNMMENEVCSLAYNIKKVSMVRICSRGNY